MSSPRSGPSSGLLSGLAVAAAATFVAAIVSVFAVGGSSTSTTTASSPTSSSVPADITPGPGTVAGSPTTQPGASTTSTLSTAPRGVSTTTPASTVPPTTPLPAGAGPVGDPGQPTAAVPGKYLYNYTEWTTGEAPSSGTLTSTIATVSAAAGVTKETIADTGSAALAQNQTVEWRPQGYYELQREFVFNGTSASCAWNPAIQMLASGLAVGRQWTLNGSCVVTAYGQAVNVHLTGTAKVTGKERLKVGADSVDVWDIAQDYTATASNPVIGTFSIHDTGVDRVAARLGLLIEEDATEVVASASTARTAHLHEALQNIHHA